VGNAFTKNVNGVPCLDPNNQALNPIPMADNDPYRAAYSLFLPSFVPVANTTDFLQIQGSATKTIKIRQISFTGTATAASNILPTLVRRSTAATGSTPTVQTLLPRDTRNTAATAVVTTFQGANPTTGTLVGILDGARLNIAPAANGGIDRLLFQFSWLNEQALTLSGTGDFICFNLAGAAWPAGGQLDISLALTEE
jgi:hypothetical protein